MLELTGTSGHLDQPASVMAEGSAPTKVNMRHIGRGVCSGLPRLCDSQKDTTVTPVLLLYKGHSFLLGKGGKIGGVKLV